AQAGVLKDERGPWAARDGFRLNGPARFEAHLALDGVRRRAAIVREGEGYRVETEDAVLTTRYVFGAQSPEGAPARIGFETANGAALDVVFLDPQTLVGPEGDVHAFGPLTFADEEAGAGEDAVLAPLPGKLVSVAVKPGAKVKRGEILALLEAMKMEHALKAPRDGVVAEVAAEAGAQVKLRDLIVRLAAAEGARDG
ncbi:MAG TPA: biotin/lipoyl-containing protein, partial [Caulobacterales bacterium]|nr:biotin/lipoyl-containing protein [Caulobacterales bacterium]